MKIFVYEYVCGGGLAGRLLPESLAQEGWAMLASIVEDFARIQGCEVITTLDERFVGRQLDAHKVERVARAIGSTRSMPDWEKIERERISKLAAISDWSLIIAPETDHVLLDRVRWVEQAGGRLLGPGSDAVAIASDKMECSRVLERAGIPVVTAECIELHELERQSYDVHFPIVLKPRDGAGSQATFLIRNTTELAWAVAQARAELPTSDFIVQPYVQGTAASVSVLIGAEGSMALLPSEQLLSDDGRLSYRGGRIPLEDPLASRAVSLALRAVAALPGLRGYVGVDLVLGSEISASKSQISSGCNQPGNSPLNHALAHASGWCFARNNDGSYTNPKRERGGPVTSISNLQSQIDMVLEINPRLTTSYVGLRQLARCNLAELQVQVVARGRASPIESRSETIVFSASGQIAYSLAGLGITSC